MTKPFPLIPPDTTADQLLTALNDWLVANSPWNEGLKFWNITAAFRGPDIPDVPGHLLKRATLAIRKAALPYANNFSWPHFEDGDDAALREVLKNNNDNHFVNHLALAYDRLQKMGRIG